jgi:hypothetical protein
MTHRAIYECQLESLWVKFPNLDAIVMDCYEFGRILFKELNICAFLITLIACRLETFTFTLVHVPDDDLITV